MVSPIRIGLRRLAGAVFTLATVGLAAGAVALGTGTLAERAARAPAPPAAPLVPVASATVDLVPGYTVERRFLGQVEARATSEVGFEFGGRLTEVLADEGDLIPAGAVVARTDTSALLPQRAALAAERDALAADLELSRLALSRADLLTERGHRTQAAQDEARLAVARTEARMAALAAQIAGIEVQIGKAEVRAPFDARVGARRADPGQAVAAGQPILTLHEAGPPRLRVGLPPHLAAGLAPGDAVTVDLGGHVVAAQVEQLRPDLDPLTRTQGALVALPPDAGMALGQTAALILTEEVPEPGFWAPLDALREGARGSWTVLAIDPGPEGDAVVPAAVEVIHAAAGQVFLRGQLPPGNRIVGTGAGRVAPGQIVLVLAD